MAGSLSRVGKGQILLVLRSEMVLGLVLGFWESWDHLGSLGVFQMGKGQILLDTESQNGFRAGFRILGPLEYLEAFPKW